MNAQMACDAESDMCMHSWMEFEFIHPPYFVAFIVLLHGVDVFPQSRRSEVLPEISI